MIATTKGNVVPVSAVLMIVLVMSCTPTKPDLSGNSTQVGNGMVSGFLYLPDGTTPAPGAVISLRKKNTLADITPSLTKFTAAGAITDINGQFSIDSIDTGLYVIEGTDGENNFVLIDPVYVKHFDSTLVLPPDTLKPAGAVRGVIRLPEGGDPRKVFVLAFGLDRFTTADTNGCFRFERLAEGNYHLRIMPLIDDYGVLDTMNIPVTSADTFSIGCIDLPFIGIPVIHTLSVTYDTLRQWVTLQWSKPATDRANCCNIYRRETDPTTAIFTQLNLFPVTDTFFIDSLGKQNRTYEYRITVVDSNTAEEGAKSGGSTARIALYEITPDSVAISYDTLHQTITVRWSNPDTARVKSFNLYRRNVSRNEVFWTPFNNRPLVDTFFIDSTFKLNRDDDSGYEDTLHSREPTFEYCVAALIHNRREGVRSAGIPVRISLKYLTPANLNFTCDTLRQMVHLGWSKPDMTLVEGFAVFRRSIDGEKSVVSRIGNTGADVTVYVDSTGEQNRTYAYSVGSVVKNSRAVVTGGAVEVRVASSYTEDSVFAIRGSEPGQISFPNDIAVAANGDIYIVDQGNGRIQVFDSTMRYKRQIGEAVLDYPLKVSVDDDGQVFAANYDGSRDVSSVYIFDSSGSAIDTILDSTVINDIDAAGGRLYALTEGRIIAVHAPDGEKLRSWQTGGQDGGKWIVAGDSNRIFFSTGMMFPDKNRVIAFDSLGNGISAITLPYYPYAMAFDNAKRLLYIVCYEGTRGSRLHVVDENNVEKASYKISNGDQNIAIGIRKDGTVYLAIKGDGKILKLKPVADF